MSLDHFTDRARRSGSRVLIAGLDAPAVEEMAALLTGAGLRPAFVIGGEKHRTDTHPRLGEAAQYLRSRRPERVKDGIHALDLASEPLLLAAGLIGLGAAHAAVACPGVTVGQFAHAAGWVRSRTPEAPRTLSWLLTTDGALVAVADCAGRESIPPGDRAELAREAAAAHGHAGDGAPSVAFLAGPAPDGDAAEQACREFTGLMPGMPAVVERAPRFRSGSNVLIFPGGAAGHLATHAARELGGALLLGPMVLGGPGVFMALPAGATAQEQIGTIALAALVGAGLGS